MTLGLGIALVSAVGTNLSALFKARGAGSRGQSGYAIRCAVPPICFGRGGSRSDGSSR
jgi:hypothetical protein